MGVASRILENPDYGPEDHFKSALWFIIQDFSSPVLIEWLRVTNLATN